MFAGIPDSSSSRLKFTSIAGFGWSTVINDLILDEMGAGSSKPQQHVFNA